MPYKNDRDPTFSLDSLFWEYKTKNIGFSMYPVVKKHNF